jgi:hypothetical protein
MYIHIHIIYVSLWTSWRENHQKLGNQAFYWKVFEYQFSLEPTRKLGVEQRNKNEEKSTCLIMSNFSNVGRYSIP